MHFSITSILALGLSTLPLSLASQIEVTSDIIQQIAPKSSSCTVETSKECRTAAQAAPFINQAFQHYGIYHPNQMAAVISLMALESGEFVYKRNVNPGRPGQGTANMQMAKFNFKYGKSLEDLRDKLCGIDTTEGKSAEVLNGILDMVVVDEHNFGSAAWFLRSECPQEVMQKLEADVDDGFVAYMECVGVTVDEARLVYLRRAKVAFGLE